MREEYGSYALVLDNRLELQLSPSLKKHYDALIQPDGTIIAAQCISQK